MIVFDHRAVDDLQSIRTEDGQEVMLMLFEWSQHLDEAATRITAERLGGSDPVFRLRVENYHITFQLLENGGDDVVRITRVRRRNSNLPPS